MALFKKKIQNSKRQEISLMLISTLAERKALRTIEANGTITNQQDYEEEEEQMNNGNTFSMTSFFKLGISYCLVISL